MAEVCPPIPEEGLLCKGGGTPAVLCPACAHGIPGHKMWGGGGRGHLFIFLKKHF